jgi:hypothetical protein
LVLEAMMKTDQDDIKELAEGMLILIDNVEDLKRKVDFLMRNALSCTVPPIELESYKEENQ